MSEIFFILYMRINNNISHVPIKIDPQTYPFLTKYLKDNGYGWTIFQIVKPRLLFGLVKKIEFKGKIVEHHIRGYTSGMIETEFELCRLSDVFNHLTTKSYSAHNKMIEILNNLRIEYNINEEIRKIYDENNSNEFPRDIMEFPRWLFVGVLFWTPLGVIWRIGYEFKKLLNSKFVKKRAERQNKLISAD